MLKFDSALGNASSSSCSNGHSIAESRTPAKTDNCFKDRMLEFVKSGFDFVPMEEHNDIINNMKEKMVVF